MRTLFALMCALAFGQQDIQVCPTEVSEHYCFDATCGVLLAEAVLKDHLNCECTESNIGFDVTNCDPETNTLSVYYFWKPPATCRGGMAYLKPPEHNISCSTTCPAGQRYNVQERRCEACLAGQYSLSGGLSYDPPWTYLPPQFTSECLHTQSFGSNTPCSTWRTMDNYLDSGDNWEKANTENILTFQTELVQDGRVEFEYKYDAEENFDIFSLFVDANRTFEARTPTLTWNTTSIPISKGFHTLRWVYKKDGSLSKGADKAFIRSIKIFGVRRFDAECLMCPPGRFSDEAAAPLCKPCPENTHSSSFGAKVCEPCHDWEKAFAGSATCSPRLPCTANDYYEFYSPCVDGHREVSYRWTQPIKCETTSSAQGSEVLVGNGDSAVNFVKYVDVDFLQPFLEVPNNITLEPVIPIWASQQDHFELTAVNITSVGFTLKVRRIDVPPNTTGWGENLRVRWSARVQAGVELPANKTESCVPEPCRAGQSRVDGVCAFCPVGRANAVPGGECITCQRGEGAKQYVAYANWSKLSSSNTGCSGDCGTPGWRFSGAFIDSGAGHGVGATSWFAEKLPRMPAGVEFDYVLSCPVDAGYLEVQIDQTIIHRILCSGCKTEVTTVTVPIDEAIFEGKETDFVLKLNFRKAALLSFQHSCDVAKVYKLAIFSPKSGIGGFMGGDGAAGCSQCGAGRYSSNAECVDCAAGTFQDASGTDTCIGCPAGKFAYRSSSSTCLECGYHTIPNRERTGCDGSCAMTINNTAYNLAPLFDWELFAMLESKDARFSYFLMMCNSRLPYECEKLKDDKWTEIPADVTQPRPVYACISRTGKDSSGLPIMESINSGAVVGYDMLDSNRPRGNSSAAHKPSNARSGITVQIDKGANTLCLMSDLNPATQPLLTFVHFVCDPMGGPGYPTDVTPGNFPNNSALPPCVSHVEWVSANACPLCTEADQHFFDSPCAADAAVTEAGKGKTTRKYFWVEPKTCVAGVPLPQPNVTLGCDVLQAVGEHVVMSKGAVATLAVGGVLIALVGIAIVVLLVRKKRALERDNQNLRNYAQLAGDGKSKIPDVVELHTS